MRKAKETKPPVSFEDVTCLRETDRAVLVRMPGGQEHWLPKSQLDEDTEVAAEGDSGTLVISHWIAEQRGLA